jgi:hypothetical protein
MERFEEIKKESSEESSFLALNILLADAGIERFWAYLYLWLLRIFVEIFFLKLELI